MDLEMNIFNFSSSISNSDVPHSFWIFHAFLLSLLLLHNVWDSVTLSNEVSKSDSSFRKMLKIVTNFRRCVSRFLKFWNTIICLIFLYVFTYLKFLVTFDPIISTRATYNNFEHSTIFDHFPNFTHSKSFFKIIHSLGWGRGAWKRVRGEFWRLNENTLDAFEKVVRD